MTNEAWGVVGIWAKQGYTDRLAELRSLLDEMKEGVRTLSDKITEAADTY